MSLFGALNIGSSALAAQQAALQVTGNNLANAASPDYNREVADITPAPDQQLQPGIFYGSGVNLASIRRQVNDSLEARIRGSVSDNQAATTSSNYLSRVEATFNALGTNNISTQLGAYFKSWSNLANTPQDPGLRQVVLQSGQAVASTITNERTQLGNIQSDVQNQISSDASAANSYAQQLAALNVQIVTAQGGAVGTANALNDQRDAILKKLSGLLDVQTVAQGDGSVNVYVGSEPLVLAGQSRGITVQKQVVNGIPQSTIRFQSDNGPISGTSGELTALQTIQTQVANVTGQVDQLAHNLISSVNKLHASGQGTAGLTTVTAGNAISDPTAALNSTGAGLQFPPNNGSFVVHVLDRTTGLSTSTLVQVNLTGSPTDTTLNSLTASVNAIAGVKASITNGKLTISAGGPNATISFSQDSSGVIAGLGINTFFSGSDASNIAVNPSLAANTALIAAAKNGNAGDNQTALAIAALNTQPLASLNGSSLQDNYQSIVNAISGQVSDATTNVQATQAVSDTLAAQHQSLSGVSIDEESINMLKQQRAYQGAAIFITTVNNMMTTLLGIIH